jgi:plasmid replication initiation protein
MTKHQNINLNKFIVKSNSLVEARYRLSLQESHVILWLLTQIRPEDEDLKMHSMKISDFAKMIDVEVDSQYKELRKITMRLIQRGLSVYEPDTKEWLQVSWLSAAKYQTKKGIISMRFDPSLKPYLIQLKERFTKINIADTLKFKSVHALRVFELLAQYEHIGKRVTKVDELRACCGIQKDEYELYAHLKSRVIERANKEINTKTEYVVDYREIKESRKVVAIEWTFQKRTHFEKQQLEKSIAMSHELQQANMLIQKLSEHGFTKSTAQKILVAHDDKSITNALNAVEDFRATHDVKNPKSLIKAAIKEGWKPKKAT